LLLERARRGDTGACLLATTEQTAGRGRQGRAWLAPPGATLAFSLALPLAPVQWEGLSLMVGAVLADALDADGRTIALKWPNDLWLRDAEGGGRKLGGILVETVAVGEQRVVVVGVGLNVLPLPQGADRAAYGSGYACLQELRPDCNAASALEAVAVPLLRGLLLFCEQGFVPWHGRFGARDLLRGRAVHSLGAHTVAGVADGVDGTGALLVRDGATLHRIVSGEVSVRMAEAH
jgi:BirA family biotin operon repressor/biotin-[acetyl-CoA-carboxylase] ligase